MLQELKFENFKTWKSAKISFGKITGFFGTNSSGKTSLLQFLLLLKQTKEATDRALSLELNGPYVELGLYRDIIHNHDETLRLKWELAFRGEKDISLIDPSGRKTDVVERAKAARLSSEVAARDQRVVSTKIEYEIGSMRFLLAPKNGGESAFELSASGSAFRFVRTQGRAWQLPGPVKSYAFPDQARTYFQNASFLSELEAAYELQMDEIYYLGPLRDYPKRDYLWARSTPQGVGKKGERAVDAILAATVAREMRNVQKKARLKPFQEIIAYWLSHMGLIHDFKVEEIAKGSNRWQAKVQVRNGGTEALLTDVGFGVSQVLPVITLLQYVPEGSTVLLEQPEIHLHPLAQAELADVIINAATHRKIQVVLESHSEHLLLRLQRRIAEQGLESSDLKLYFCDAPDGDSQIRPLDVDMFGIIDNWPKNFMGDAFGETYAAEKARLHRKKADG
jgi:predicted ATPase